MEQTGEASTCEGGRKSFLSDHSQSGSIAEPVPAVLGPNFPGCALQNIHLSDVALPQSGGDLHSLQVLQMDKRFGKDRAFWLESESVSPSPDRLPVSDMWLQGPSA